jgi:hypothetical protein
MKFIKSLVLVVSLMLSNVSNASLMLWLDPAVQPGTTGDNVTLTLMAGNLDDLSSLSLGAFDLDILFDPAVLSFTGYTLFDGLGDIGLFEALDLSLGEYAPGVVGLSEVSLLGLVLDTIQPGEFALAELSFNITLLEAPDFTTVSMTPGLFGFADASGLDFVGVEMRSALIGTQPQTTVPEPTTLSLFALGLVFASYWRKLKA